MALKLVKQEHLAKQIIGSDKDKLPSVHSNDILKGLNERQIEAVTFIDGPLLVIAGAGSGKTRVLTHRIAYMVKNGIMPDSILALTFTNKAAREMKERISRLIADNAYNALNAGTFHSIFARILRSEARNIGYTSSFSIYDTDDSQKIIKEIMSKMGISHQQISYQNVRAKISWAKNRMISWQAYSRDSESINDKITAQIYEAYEKQLLNNNAMDFDDLLLNMIHLLNLSKEILNYYRDKFRYILVDEYQDTNRAQYIVINILAGEHKNICVVGDDAQSIYKWRGAEIKNILDFQTDYPNAKIVRLEQNYRSTKIIIEAADSVIRNNKNQLQKSLWTENEQGNPIKIIRCLDDKDEAEKITNKIKTLQDKDFQFKDIAVLYRTNAQSLAFENAFRKNNLPYIVVGNISFYKRKEIKDALAYLRILLNQADGEALNRIVNEPPRGLGNTSLNHIKTFAEINSVALFQAFERAEEIEGLHNRAKKAAIEFTDFIKNHISSTSGGNSSKEIISYIEETGLLQMYKDINTEESLDRWNNLQQFLSDITSYFRENEDGTLAEYISQISLSSEIDEADFNDNRINLMTLHSAKGLEFPVVFIAGLEQGLFPLSKSEDDLQEIEEERRLFYVGMTRAQERLYISFAERRMRFGDYKYQKPSIFLDEINKKYIQPESKKLYDKSPLKPKTKSDNKITYKSDIDGYNYSQIPADEFNFKVGDRVLHSQFGAGKITGLSGTGSNRQAVVWFPSLREKKRLMLQYAKLKLIR